MTILFAGDVPYHFVRHDSGWKWKILRHTVSRILYKTPVDKSDCDLYNLNNFKTTL